MQNNLINTVTYIRTQTTFKQYTMCVLILVTACVLCKATMLKKAIRFIMEADCRAWPSKYSEKVTLGRRSRSSTQMFLALRKA